MTSQQRTASLSEWETRLYKLLEEMDADGVEWEFTTCCCGEGIVFRRDGERYVAY